MTETRFLGFLPADPDATKVEDLKEKAENRGRTCEPEMEQSLLQKGTSDSQLVGQEISKA